MQNENLNDLIKKYSTELINLSKSALKMDYKEEKPQSLWGKLYEHDVQIEPIQSMPDTEENAINENKNEGGCENPAENTHDYIPVWEQDDVCNQARTEASDFSEKSYKNDQYILINNENITQEFENAFENMPAQHFTEAAKLSKQAPAPIPPFKNDLKPVCDKCENEIKADSMTDSLGRPIPDSQNMLTAGSGGPALLQDIVFLDKLAHFARERIPERVVHAKGAGAFGEFEVTKCMVEHTMADFLKEGRKTSVFVRFSTVIGGKGSADTARDPRGFAVKFYTNEGIYDITGLSLPVFFIRDAIKFPDLIHSLKPAPDTNIVKPERFWDFMSMSPEATHMVTWLYSDRGTVKSYRHMDGFGVNTYIWINRHGERKYIKYHWKTTHGVQTIDRKEAILLAGSDPDIASHDLYNSISSGKPVKYELFVQMMDPGDSEKLPFDPLDDTKVWDENEYPLHKVGVLTLFRNPENFFAQVEQSAFCPGNIVPGIELSADKMLQGRAFSYHDTQRHRLGTNFADLPVNRSVSPVLNNHRDGAMTYNFNPSSINYSPNSLGGNIPSPAVMPNIKGQMINGRAQRNPIEKPDDYTQAGQRFLGMTALEKDSLCGNIAAELRYVKNDIKECVLEHFKKACPEFEKQVRQYIG